MKILTERYGEVEEAEDGNLTFSGVYKFKDVVAKFTLAYTQDKEDF